MPTTDAIVCDLSVVMKGSTSPGGARIISLEASNEQMDSEFDIILQKALLDSAESFIKSGIIDYEHLGTVGAKYGLRQEDYVVGRPLEVHDLGENRTGVVAELNSSKFANRIWDSLQGPNPEVWKASIYGFPTGPDSVAKSQQGGRFVVKAINWVALAVCRRPINTAIKMPVRIGGAEAFMKSQLDLGLLPEDVAEIIKASYADAAQVTASPTMLPPRNRLERLGLHDLHMLVNCPHCGPDSMFGHSVAGFRTCFELCCGLPYDSADTEALALAHQLKHR